jgi:hypothetical protein
MPDNHLASKFNADLGLTLIRLLETAGQSEKADLGEGPCVDFTRV